MDRSNFPQFFSCFTFVDLTENLLKKMKASFAVKQILKGCCSRQQLDKSEKLTMAEMSKSQLRSNPWSNTANWT